MIAYFQFRNSILLFMIVYFPWPSFFTNIHHQSKNDIFFSANARNLCDPLNNDGEYLKCSMACIDKDYDNRYNYFDIPYDIRIGEIVKVPIFRTWPIWRKNEIPNFLVRNRVPILGHPVYIVYINIIMKYVHSLLYTIWGVLHLHIAGVRMWIFLSLPCKSEAPPIVHSKVYVIIRIFTTFLFTFFTEIPTKIYKK